VIEVEDRHGRWLAVAIRAFARQNGGGPDELLALADELLAPRVRDTGPDPAARARRLAAARQRRSRARRRGEVVPVRRPGPARDRDIVALLTAAG
jgi:hypothetical protein